MTSFKQWQHHWHPCSQISDFELFPPLAIESAKGGWLTTKKGQQVFDATSSWWCKHLGHRHPNLVAALNKQSQQLIHSIGANTTSDAIVELSYRLAQLTTHLSKVF